MSVPCLLNGRCPIRHLMIKPIIIITLNMKDAHSWLVVLNTCPVPLPTSIKWTVSDEPKQSIPWTALTKPLADCTFSLITTGGLYQRGVDTPFNIERERQEPTWGDPTFRTIPTDIKQETVAASHLHINTQWALEDINCLLPVHRFQELGEEGKNRPFGPLQLTRLWASKVFPMIHLLGKPPMAPKLWPS